jgi:hypothetical protein
MNSDLLHILQHSLGLNHHGQGRMYRNYFCIGKDSTDWDKCVQLVDTGLMQDRGPQALAAGDHYFVVTGAGIAAVAQHSSPPPKLTRSQKRYRAYLDSDIGISFGEWLKHGYYRPREYA